MVPQANPFAVTREHYRLSQDQWAKAFGVARSTISAWEMGEALPPPVAQGAYRKLQEPIWRGDLASLERTRQALLQVGDRAQQEAERLNRGQAQGSELVRLIKITAAALALGLLFATLFKEEAR